jgi:polysaccharide pyruvyl transferase CsaB
MSKTIFIAGYYGFGNAGDEAILASMLKDFRELSVQSDVIVVSGNPKQTEQSHGVKAVPWTDISKIALAIQDCDVVLIGGGGIFHDYWGVDESTILTSEHIGISFYSSIALFASIYDKPLMLYAVGVGPLTDEAGKRQVRAIIEQADLVTVRDEESRLEVLDLGVVQNHLYRTADPAFRFSVNSIEADDGRTQGLLLGVALRNWDVGVTPEEWELQVANGIDLFLDAHPAASVIFIPFQDGKDKLLDDYGCSLRVQKKLRNKKSAKILKVSSTLEEKVIALNRCNLVIGMRLHALILAARRGIPVVGLIYDPKLKRLMNEIGLAAYVMRMDEANDSSLLQLLEKALKQRELISKNIVAVSNEMAKRATQSVQLVERMLAGEFHKKNELSQSAQKTLLQTAFSLSQMYEFTSLQNNELKKTFSNLQDQIQRLDIENEVLQQTLAQKKQEHDKAVSKFEAQAGSYRQQIALLEEKNGVEALEIAGLTFQLAEIKNSKGWKLLWMFWQIRLFFIPNGSKREQILGAIWQGFWRITRRVYRIPKKAFMQLAKGTSFDEDIFLRFKQKRQSKFEQSLDQLEVPCQKDLVSIVLPVYNGEKYIAEALESILNQTYRDFEVIVVDDGSEDRTGEILGGYARRDNRIQVVHQKNQKISSALNHGFRLARGEFLAWTSHDNRLKPDFLEKMVGCLKRHSDWDMIYANLDIIGEDGTPLRDSDWYGGYQQPAGSEHVFLPVDTAVLNVWPNNFIGGAFLYRNRVRSLIGGYNPYNFTREDYDYWMRVNALLTLRHADFDEPVYEYRFHRDALTSQDVTLGITSNRKYLMVFDDFRRDFYTMPLMWVVDDSDLLDEKSQSVLRAVRGYILETGDHLLEIARRHKKQFSDLWLPCVYLKLTSDPMVAPVTPAYLPDSTVPVLLCVTTENISEPAHLEWELSLVLSDGGFITKRAGIDLQNWWGAKDLEVLLHSIDIYVRSHHLARIEDVIAQPGKSESKASVIICTYKRNEVLKESLRSIAKQSIPQAEYEVIVVDNNPTDSGAEVVVNEIRKEEFRDNPNKLRFVKCPIAGLSYARNAGIAEARSDILIFMDDDATASKYLVEQYWNAFSMHPNAGVIGGHIVLERPESISMIWKEGWERYWSQFITGYEDYTEVENWWEFPWGANWASRRKSLMQTGGFRGKYGRSGSNFNGGEEIVAASLVQRLGYTVAVLPQAEVVHHVEEKRFTLEHLRKTIRAAIFVQYQAHLDLYLPSCPRLGEGVTKIVPKFFKFLLRSNEIESKAEFIETRIHFLARWHLLKHQISEYYQRKKRYRQWKKAQTR